MQPGFCDTMGTELSSLGDFSFMVGFPSALVLSQILTVPHIGLGALLAIAAIKAHSFGGFCTCIFVIGNGLGALETAANPYITGEPGPGTLFLISSFETMNSLRTAEICRNPYQYLSGI